MMLLLLLLPLLLLVLNLSSSSNVNIYSSNAYRIPTRRLLLLPVAAPIRIPQQQQQQQQHQQQQQRQRKQQSSSSLSLSAKTDEITSSASVSSSSSLNSNVMIRDELLDMLSSLSTTAKTTMPTRSDDDNDDTADSKMRRIEVCINTLEDKYVPCQTVSFLNLLMNGSWQFLFSTNIINRTATTTSDPTTTSTTRTGSRSFHLREMKQHIQTPISDHQHSPVATIATVGNVTNTCIWELNQQQQPPPPRDNNDDVSDVTTTTNTTTTTFDCYGTFAIKSDYSVTTTGRIVQCQTDTTTDNSNDSNATTSDEQQQEQQQQPELVLELLPKSTIPNNVSQLIYYLQRTICQELFDIRDSGYDITYMDDTIRIVRYYTPTKYDGIRNIFRRC